MDSGLVKEIEMALEMWMGWGCMADAWAAQAHTCSSTDRSTQHCR